MDRFFSQNFANSLIVIVSLHRAMPFEVFITLSALCVFEVGLIVLTKIPRWINVPQAFLTKFLWVPVLC
jgi:hypothetical protein